MVNSASAHLKKNAHSVKTRDQTDVMSLRKDNQIQSKRSLLQSGASQQEKRMMTNENRSPKILANASN